MDISLAIRILVNAGLTVCRCDNLVAVGHPTRRVTVEEVQQLLQPYEAGFVTFYQVYETVQVFFD